MLLLLAAMFGSLLLQLLELHLIGPLRLLQGRDPIVQIVQLLHVLVSLLGRGRQLLQHDVLQTLHALVDLVHLEDHFRVHQLT